MFIANKPLMRKLQLVICIASRMVHWNPHLKISAGFELEAGVKCINASPHIYLKI